MEISRVLQGNLSEVEGEEIEEIVRGVSEKEGIKEIDFDGFVRCVEKIY